MTYVEAHGGFALSCMGVVAAMVFIVWVMI
jgi:hypothetical protein